MAHKFDRDVYFQLLHATQKIRDQKRIEALKQMNEQIPEAATKWLTVKAILIAAVLVAIVLLVIIGSVIIIPVALVILIAYLLFMAAKASIK
mgnify:CR=1 FL=1